MFVHLMSDKLFSLSLVPSPLCRDKLKFVGQDRQECLFYICSKCRPNKYNNGNKKIQTMSTKCQYNPDISTGL